MSRCIPFPPRGYVWKGVSGKALLEVIQLERSSLTEEHDHHGLYDSSDNTENVRPKSVTQEQLSSASTASSVQHIESQFRELMVHCVPSPIQTEHCEFDDQEWLFERRLPPSSSSSRKNPPAVSSASNADDDSCLASSSTYPSARYLPRADIYALPYTVLF
ncbi:hypothetical protein JRO89_XS02G0018200 [Xanthoceras sorbifolium]|uniref:Uncharacterized protein n=1 Tax=Xanthoceras sorbifolium TaxID=99658 RepID=A0ABQ8IDX2_9ROSI|nr:hypothetical protein JRO89_XS02G0018200 [Xanthoceras sorbifolium]